MKAVVTGGAGFIGSHIVDALLAQGTHVLVIDDLSTGNRRNLSSAEAKAKDRITFAQLDICSEQAMKEVEAFAPDAVFHHAAQMNVRLSVAQPVFDAQKNVVGTVAMLEAARRAGTKRFFMASTGGAIYGEQISFPAKENHRSEPECPYGVSKHAGELYLEYFARAHAMQTVALRYANVYGPRQNPKGEAGVVAIFAQRILSREPVTVNGDGLQTRDFVFVRDVVAANMAVLSGDPLPGFSVFNVGRGTESTVLDIAHGLAAAAKKKDASFTIDLHHGPALAGEQRRSVIDAGKLSAQFGWKPQTALEDGLAQTLESFRCS